VHSGPNHTSHMHNCIQQCPETQFPVSVAPVLGIKPSMGPLTSGCQCKQSSLESIECSLYLWSLKFVIVKAQEHCLGSGE